jgi:Protein of unknown function (DUF2516)
VLYQTQNIAYLLLTILIVGLSGFAFIDCLRRPAQAFPAIGRQTKVLWLILTGLSTLANLAIGDPLSLFGIAGAVIALVYLFDVRPRIIEILNNRW